MSNRYKGGIISATPPTTTGGNDGVASGSWTLEQQMQAQAAGNWPNQPVFYIEDVFSTWLYTGTGSAQTITNGINLSGKGGLVWSKNRTQVDNNRLYDTVRGTNNVLISNSTSAALADSSTVIAFNSNGYSIGTSGNVNFSGDNFVSWTFREQQKFFDVVTWTGNGSQPRTITHNLGSVPGCIIVKRTDTPSDWAVYHRAVDPTTPQGYRLELNTTSERVATTSTWNNQAPTSTEFYIGSATYNGSGNTYVAYLFAHNAGGFGLTGTDNVISCGSYTGAWPSTVSVNLGYEPQWVLVKNVTTGGYNWLIQDNMRGMPNSSASSGWAALYPNTSGTEQNFYSLITPTATGFIVDINAQGSGAVNNTGDTYIYIAIRRGPMRTPTTGTSVYAPVSYSGTGTTNFISSGFVVDAEIVGPRTVVRAWKSAFASRLTGTGRYLTSSSTAVEQTDGPAQEFASNTGVLRDGTGMNSTADSPLLTYMLQRAPGFFDVVCYTGVNPGGQTLTVSHNLGVAPELIINKRRSNSYDWLVYSAPTGSSNTLYLNLTNASTAYTSFSDITSTTFKANGVANTDTDTYVSYLFASCPGVSKVGSYTGTGTTQVINCGFTAGSRFVMIKRTDSTGDWYVWDSARGIVAGNDPYLLLNSTAAEVTNTDFVDTAATGFEITSTAPAAINANGGTFIFLAVA